VAWVTSSFIDLGSDASAMFSRPGTSCARSGLDVAISVRGESAFCHLQPNDDGESIQRSMPPSSSSLSTGLVTWSLAPAAMPLESLLWIASRKVGDIGSYAEYVVAEAASNTDDDACLVVVHVR
jgi:hypothetical protein